MRSEFLSVPFEDATKAEGNLERVGLRLAPGLLQPLASLLSESPDPDGALNLLDRYVQGAPPEVLEDLLRHPSALTYLVAIFGYSAFLAESFLADPSLPIQFARDRHFAKLKSWEDLMQDYARFSTTSPDPWLSAQLARFKRRNYLRIVLKDVLGLSTLGETTLELSALSDVILANALFFCDQELEKRYGQPQYRDAQGRIAHSEFSVVSLGKLGGNELNYSSDIDLLFLYSHDGETAGSTEPHSQISNKEYAVRLAHAITRTITQSTPHGLVFRVDLRLRPEGEQGDLAISVKSATEYYEHRARDWELQMLIKARHSAGGAEVTRAFLRNVEPYIYASAADFSAIESVLWSREKISKKLRENSGDSTDVKLHRGGIRDIEFLSQCLQRLHGGRDPWVRSGGTLHGLRKLNDKGLLANRDYATLTAAYDFLRKIEHRIQLDMGQQSHRLPADPRALDRLARRVGLPYGRPGSSFGRTPPSGSQRPGALLEARVEQVFEQVDEIYQRVIHPHAGSDVRSTFGLRPVPLAPGDAGANSYAATLSFLDVQAPDLARLVRDREVPERVRSRVAAFFASLLESSERFRLAREQPRQIAISLDVIAASDFLADLLIHHPEEVAVIEPAAGDGTVQASAAQLEMPLESPATPAERQAFPWAADAAIDMREKTALLRRHFRSAVVALGVADLPGFPSIFGCLDRWSALAARSISSALRIAEEALGVAPAGCAHSLEASLEAGADLATSTSHADCPLAVLGLGRLGVREFDLGSDADLVFVVASGTSRDEVAFRTRLAGKTIDVLSSYTRDGTLFAVDTRLRPRGREGELVITVDELLAYLHDTAQPWEGLTYLKIAPVAGNLALGTEISAQVHQGLLERFAAFPDLEGELHQMRRRLEREVTAPPTNTKTAPGGYYDVDFCVSYLSLRHRVELGVGSNMAERISTLGEAGLIGDEDARVLSSGAAFLRSVDHAVRLVVGKPADGLPEHVGQAEALESLAHRWGLTPGEQPLAARLRGVQQEIRYVYRRLIELE